MQPFAVVDIPKPQTRPLRVLILAAGRGERMRPLTDECPKPLLPVRGRPLIEWHLLALAQAGVRDVVINTAWLETQFPAALGDGARWGLRIHYSHEQRDHGQALETAGGIVKALPLLSPRGDEAFGVISGDIHAPAFRFDLQVPAIQAFLDSEDHALLWMVPNPAYHPAGDFRLDAHERLHRPGPPPDRTGSAQTTLTYANFGLMRPSLVDGVPAGVRAPLGPCLHRAADAGRLAGLLWSGDWENVGTPEQWRALQPL